MPTPIRWDMPCAWQYENFDVISYAINGGDFNMSLIQYANEVYHKNILSDDIVVWQLTGPDRFAVNQPEFIDDATMEDGVLRCENIYTDREINLVNFTVSGRTEARSPILPDYASRIAQALEHKTHIYNILWQLNGVKRQNNKLLVVFGWDTCFNDYGIGEKNKIVSFLKDCDIDYIEESIYEYSIRKGHKISDTSHPPDSGYKDFTQNRLLPKLKKLNWL
jgi:hypothetical protein